MLHVSVCAGPALRLDVAALLVFFVFLMGSSLQRAGLSEELARLKDTRVHVSSALALREKQLALAHTSLHRQTLRHETLRTELVAACARLTGAHTDAVLCAPRVDSYVAAERASVSSMTRLLALVAAIQTRSRSARFEDELRRLHAAFVLTRSAHAHRRIAHGALHQLEFAAAAGDDAAHVTQQLRRQALAILERVPALVAEVALLPCQRVVLADVEAKVTALQQLQHAASTLATALRDQNSRLIAVRSTLREETEHCCHAATLLKAVTEEFHGAAEMCAQRTAAIGAPPDVAADNNDAGALARIRLLTLASGRPGASEAAMLEALDKAATAGLAARAAAADEMRAAVRTFEALHKQVAPLLFPLGGAQAQWRAPEVAEQLERCRDALRRAGESLASVEKQRARVEAEWTHRPPPLVQLERNMMALFWEDPVSTAKLNAQLAKVAAL